MDAAFDFLTHRQEPWRVLHCISSHRTDEWNTEGNDLFSEL
jgi:hypothetical protein